MDALFELMVANRVRDKECEPFMEEMRERTLKVVVPPALMAHSYAIKALWEMGKENRGGCACKRTCDLLWGALGSRGQGTWIWIAGNCWETLGQGLPETRDTHGEIWVYKKFTCTTVINNLTFGDEIITWIVILLDDAYSV